MSELTKIKRLIKCVEKRRELWDRSMKVNSTTREKSWEKIAACMYTNWKDICKEERQDKGM